MKYDELIMKLLSAAITKDGYMEGLLLDAAGAIKDLQSTIVVVQAPPSEKIESTEVKELLWNTNTKQFEPYKYRVEDRQDVDT